MTENSSVVRIDAVESRFEEGLMSLSPYRYKWPTVPLQGDSGWRSECEGKCYVRKMPEPLEELGRDSSWPAFFPAPVCLVTTSDGERTAMEREVGASIVNRFPYVVALSVCRHDLSARHHSRAVFMEVLETSGVASLQFLAPGTALDKALAAIQGLPDRDSTRRIDHTGLKTRRSITHDAPAFASAYMVYEVKFVRPQTDFEGRPIYETPWIDVGSHRVYFLEIAAIQLEKDIATGLRQIHWRALPSWHSEIAAPAGTEVPGLDRQNRYQKGYNPNYSYPTANTIAFEFDEVKDGMAIKYLPPLPEDQVEVDNDRARWPCFFPSSCGLITTWADDGAPNIMPCGSTTMVSRYPLVVAPCISYAKINERYAPRKTLEFIENRGRFGCGVPYLSEAVVDAIKYAGNNSLADDPRKVRNSGLRVEYSDFGPVIVEAPVHFDCEVIGKVLLGTHVMFFGKVCSIRVRSDVTPGNPLEWYPWAAVN